MRIQRSFATDGLDIWLIDYRNVKGLTRGFVAEPIQLNFKEVGGEGFLLPTPTLSIDGRTAKELESALKHGIDMSGLFNREDFNAELKAKEAHIRDLQKQIEVLSAQLGNSVGRDLVQALRANPPHQVL